MEDLSDTRTRISKLERSQSGLRASVDALHNTVRDNALNQRNRDERFFREVRALREELHDDLKTVHKVNELQRGASVGRELRLREHSVQIESIQLQIDKRAERRHQIFNVILGALGSLALLVLGWMMKDFDPWW